METNVVQEIGVGEAQPHFNAKETRSRPWMAGGLHAQPKSVEMPHSQGRS